MSENTYHEDTGKLKLQQVENGNIVIRRGTHCNSVYFTMMDQTKCFSLEVEFRTEEEADKFFQDESLEKATKFFKAFVN